VRGGRRDDDLHWQLQVDTLRVQAGQRMDGFGLMDYTARYYSSTLGRFVSPDTIIPQPGNPMAWDRYGYVNSNPVKYTDPSGHMLDDGCHSSGAPEIQMQLFTLFIWVGFPAIVKPDTTSLGERAENSYDPSGEKIRQGQVLNSCFWS